MMPAPEIICPTDGSYRRHSLFQTGDMTMQTKINLAMSAMVFGVGVVILGSAFAQNPGVRVPICPTCGDYGNAYVSPGYYGNSYVTPGYSGNSHVTPGHRSPAPQHLQKKLPSAAFGSVGGIRGAVISPPGRPFETDPDPNIRFEMNRDDFDRRHGV
jgi:hypothetical protein